MKLTIGMAVYDDFKGLYFTLQALRFYHDITDAEFVIVDNKGDSALKDWLKYWMPGYRYVKYTRRNGTTQPRQRIFEVAEGDFVLCIDSHVLMMPGSITALLAWINDNPACDALLHGPLVYDNGCTYVTHMEPVWRENMWGIWADAVKELPKAPFEIPMHGLGLFAAHRKSWLGFNPAFRGFGGEEGYIHEKYRQHGRQVLCLPFLKWMHYFGLMKGTGYTVDLRDRVCNYFIGFWELGLSTQPIIEHFGKRLVEAALYDCAG